MLYRTIMLLNQVCHILIPKLPGFQLFDQLTVDDDMLSRERIPGIKIAKVAVNGGGSSRYNGDRRRWSNSQQHRISTGFVVVAVSMPRSEEHTSELQSRGHLVCRLLRE